MEILGKNVGLNGEFDRKIPRKSHLQTKSPISSQSDLSFTKKISNLQASNLKNYPNFEFKLATKQSTIMWMKKIKNFMLKIEEFCLKTGGYSVVDFLDDWVLDV